MFPALQGILNELLDGLGDSSIAKNIGELLKRGDLSGIVDVLDDASRTAEAIQLVDCLMQKAFSVSNEYLED